jgi:hypothetical protein
LLGVDFYKRPLLSGRVGPEAAPLYSSGTTNGGSDGICLKYCSGGSGVPGGPPMRVAFDHTVPFQYPTHPGLSGIAYHPDEATVGEDVPSLALLATPLVAAPMIAPNMSIPPSTANAIPA